MAPVANILRSELACRTYDHDPADASVATQVAWVPMGLNFLAILKVTAGAVVADGFRIYAATDDQGTDATLVRAHDTPTLADAAGDNLVLEVDAAEVQAALAGATHVSVRVDMNGATDEASVTYIRKMHRQYSGLTADVIS